LPPQTLRRITPKRIANSARQLVASYLISAPRVCLYEVTVTAFV
jgi:hypothetical protein